MGGGGAGGGGGGGRFNISRAFGTAGNNKVKTGLDRGHLNNFNQYIYIG